MIYLIQPLVIIVRYFKNSSGMATFGSLHVTRPVYHRFTHLGDGAVVKVIAMRVFGNEAKDKLCNYLVL